MEIRTIPGYPMYGASADGNVWSMHTPDGSWRMLAQSTNGKYGYSKVNLTSPSGRLQTKKVHSLIALCFIGPRPHKLDVNHKDGIKQHNTVENLEYCTRKRNMEHSYELGLRKPPKQPTQRRHRLTGRQLVLIPETACGERIPSHKLTAEDVTVIRRELA